MSVIHRRCRGGPGIDPLTVCLRDYCAASRPSAEVEAELVRRVRAGDPEARNAMVVGHLGLVPVLARRFSGNGIDLEDLIQEGCLVLIRCVGRHRPEQGSRFANYAAKSIRLTFLRMAERRVCRVASTPDSLPDRRAGPHRDVDAADLPRCLGPDVRAVLRFRFGLDGTPPMLVPEIAERMGIGRVTAWRYEREGLARLRESGALRGT